MKAFKNNQEVQRFLRFMVVGSVGAVVDFGIFNLLSSVFKVTPVIAQVFSFTLAVVSNFVWNRYWTYPDSRSKPLTQQVVQFILISVIGLAIRTPLFAFLEKQSVQFFSRILSPGTLSPVFLGHNISLAIAIVVIMFWNFLANRYWTYNDVSKTASTMTTTHES
jgi:putative flippase GtrA